MSWTMRVKILNIEQVSVYAAFEEYMHFTKIVYKWEAIR